MNKPIGKLAAAILMLAVATPALAENYAGSRSTTPGPHGDGAKGGGGGGGGGGSNKPTDNPTILADRAKIKVDYAKYKTDEAPFRPALEADEKAIAADRAAVENEPAVKAATEKLKADRVTFDAQIAADKPALEAVRAADGPALSADEAKIKEDQGNPTALAADQARLEADRAKFRTDAGPAYTKLIADLKAREEALKPDYQALEAASQSPALQADLEKYKTDKAACDAKVQPDVTQLKADLQQLEADTKAAGTK